MAKTRRQHIRSMLFSEHQTVRSVSLFLGVGLKDTEREIQHVVRSVGRDKLEVEPAACEGCGFVFKDRRRLTTPSRCPRCRCERISEPVFWFRGDEE